MYLFTINNKFYLVLLLLSLNIYSLMRTIPSNYCTLDGSVRSLCAMGGAISITSVLVADFIVDIKVLISKGKSATGASCNLFAGSVIFFAIVQFAHTMLQ